MVLFERLPVPCTTILGRNRSIGTSAAPLRAAGRSGRPARPGWPPAAEIRRRNRNDGCPKRSDSSGCASSQRDTQSVLAGRRAAGSTLYRRQGVPRKSENQRPAAALAQRGQAVLPDGDGFAARFQAGTVQRDQQVGHVGRRYAQRAVADRGAYERHARPLALRHELPAAVDQHPAPVVCQPARSIGDSLRSMPAQDLMG